MIYLHFAVDNLIFFICISKFLSFFIRSVPTITPQSAIAPNQSKLNTLSSLTSNRASPPVSTSRPVVSSSPSTQQSTTYASVHSVTKVIPNQTAGHNTLSEAANNPLTPPISKVLSAQAKNVAIAFQPVSHTAEVGRIIASPPVVSPGMFSHFLSIKLTIKIA